jgi:hypothetical protein
MKQSRFCLVVLGLSVCFPAYSTESQVTQLEEKVTESFGFLNVTEREFNLPTSSGNVSASVYSDTQNKGGWVFLQHGFFRNKKNMKDLATKLAQMGYPVVTVSLNTSQIHDGTLAENLLNSILTNPPAEIGENNKSNYILMGHSAGAKFVTQMTSIAVKKGMTTPQALIWLDGVDRDKVMETALVTIREQSQIDVMGISGKAGACNANTAANDLLKQLKPAVSFVGVKVNSGSHCDAEGSSSDFGCSLACGGSKPANVEALQILAKGWVGTFLSKESGTTYFPGGESFETLKKAGTIESL